MFLESLEPGLQLGGVPSHYDHHHDDQEAQECPWRGHLEENWCLDGIFLIYNQHIICFRNPCNQDYNLGVVPVMMITIMMIRKLRNVLGSGHLEENRCLDRMCLIYTQHIICFWNPWNQDCNLRVLPVIMITIMMSRKLRNVPEVVIWRRICVMMGFF